MVRIFRKSRRTRGLALASVAVLLAILMALPAAAGPVGIAAGFEDDDGNLADDVAGIPTDWNDFSAGNWTGTAPSRQSSFTAEGWAFTGLEDWQATTADSGFAGGTKQDNNCPSVITAKAPNKDDLKRVYLATKTVQVGGVDHVFLELAWVRIPQNTTSASAHIGFEFNKGTAGCAGPGGLVNRVAGDMLIVYDFEGSSTDNPTLTLRRWVTSGACEVSSNSAPCWGVATNLTAGGFAEGKVNTLTSAQDTVAPATETLGLNEFGEAGVDLTAAGVFTAGQCESFGKAYAVSRSSGNSGTAQMKDIVGPANFSLQNCGTVTIIKRTSPRGVDQNFGFTSTLAGTCSPDTSPASFTLNDKAGATGDSTAVGGNTEACTLVPAGSYTVTEGANPTGFEFTDLSCTATGTGTTATPASGNSTKTASITIAGGGSVICVYTNTQQQGAILITKTRKHAAEGPGDHPHAGVSFTVDGVTKVTNASGQACFDGLDFASYTVHETVPAGYSGEGDKVVVVDNNATCSAVPYVGETVSFSNTPLTDITVTVNSQVDGGTASTITCDQDAPVSTGANGDGSTTKSDLPPGTYTCVIFVDP